jgi:predicted molibdopterin-dependent oxidoreductase YjgC
VVQDIFLTETAQMADVVLPAASFAEKEGTFTNTERRVQRVRKAIEPIGESRDDLSIIDMISARMHFGYNTVPSYSFNSYRHGGESTFRAAYANTAKHTFDEMAQVWPALAGINYDRLEHEGIQWPCSSTDHPGTPVLFEERFPIGKAIFSAIEWHKPNEGPDAEYPLILTTGRVLQQYHTGTMTRRSQIIEDSDRGAHVEINPVNAESIGIEDGDQVHASTRRGTITLPAFITTKVQEGTVFIPFHYKEACANLLTNDALDPVCKIPEAKVCAVRIEKQV